MSFKDKAQKTVLDVYHTATGMRPVSGDLGIEIELEGENLTPGPAIKGWSVHNEGSLRAVGGRGPGGSEYVTNGAVKHDDVIPLVERLVDRFKAAGVVIDNNAHRTSTHIHVNVQKMTWLQVLGYITTFTAVEPLLLALCGGKRDGNSFCIASYDSGDLPEVFNDTCKQIENIRESYAIEVNRGKYASLGTNRLHDFGTLEARCFPHSIDPQEIHKWCTWLLNIKGIAINETDTTYRTVIKQGLYEPLTLRARVFGYEGMWGVSDNLATELIQYGSREAYELTRLIKRYLNKPAPEPKPSKTKTFAGFAPAPHVEVNLEVAQPAQAPFRRPRQLRPLGG